MEYTISAGIYLLNHVETIAINICANKWDKDYDYTNNFHEVLNELASLIYANGHQIKLDLYSSYEAGSYLCEEYSYDGQVVLSVGDYSDFKIKFPGNRDEAEFFINKHEEQILKILKQLEIKKIDMVNKNLSKAVSKYMKFSGIIRTLTDPLCKSEKYSIYKHLPEAFEFVHSMPGKWRLMTEILDSSHKWTEDEYKVITDPDAHLIYRKMIVASDLKEEASYEEYCEAYDKIQTFIDKYGKEVLYDCLHEFM